ncbi:GspH/FimT family pseudopilin [Lichenibacterium ramalinae]|uniref:Type II secretion system protein H n=1 Tax=Lichenibacterium ramalinae TaxID=2316527 RepID=A0A4Q2RDM4_9HYPH|nr:GspH/FimT family pseudopilin [Lichenibacterium ramalinae]RYB04089.1 prepilin-type N-terminal cleavage/methylation domain-containing protein [Lichenibacterium ramalinae]
MKLRRRGGAAGFTLVELLVTMAILGGVMALVVAARPRAATLRLDATARAIASGLRAARARAMLSGTEATFVLDGAARTYGPPRDPRPLPADMAVAVAVASSERDHDAGAFRFYPDGRCTGGSLTISLGDRAVLVTVDWLTGEPWIR